MKKCFYCAVRSEEMQQVEIEREIFHACGDAHAAKILDFYAWTKRVTKFFAIGVTASVFLMFALMFVALFENDILTLVLLCIGWAGFGATLTAFPLCTPQTFRWLGIRGGMILGRIIGGVILLSTVVWPFVVL